MGQIRRWAGIVALLLGLQVAPLQARDIDYPFYGVWMITQARPAPWVDKAHTADPFLSRRWIGQKVIFLWDGVDAPFPLGCNAPRYRTVDLPPEGLFQGNLTQPVLQAHALGFRAGAPVATLQTDCDGPADFHFVDRSTAMFALDNVIYTLRRR